MTARPLVTVYNEKNEATETQIKLPGVFRAPIRPDIVNFIHDQIRKNKRQPYAVSTEAGHQTSAESWGTGRAVARIPRVRGGGTHRSGQGAFGNMCRGGRMFAPTKVYRRWHRRVNVAQKRYAIVSALAASGVPGLIQARGHIIDQIPEVPFVVSDKIEAFKKTREAVTFLRRSHVWADIEKVYNSKRYRAGKGKGRNRRYKSKLGPVVIYNQDNGVVRAFRNIPGVDLQCVDRLNLLKIAPGGHVGRLIVWTESAFRKLDLIYGTEVRKSEAKACFTMPRAKMCNADFSRLIRSEEIVKAVRPPRKTVKTVRIHRNPLKRSALMVKLNPYAAVLKRAAILAQRKRQHADDPVEAKIQENAKKALAMPKMSGKKGAVKK
ncbi:60S ribosomal protein L4 [Toxocara canis]|uniref:60S ribosomal protein L4 n=1 Tax=Toxocara canis TaxID=6265 RepID=A0A0B2V6T8_TOXCA|nr:60S ribosomal protein L4 [Toxocara canis]